MKQLDLTGQVYVESRRLERLLAQHTGQSIKENGLTIPQFAVLDIVYRYGALPVCELLKQLDATSGNMTVILKNMERDALILRQAFPNDKRKHVITLTSKGRRLYRRILPSYRSEIDTLYAPLSATEKQLLITLIQKMILEEK